MDNNKKNELINNLSDNLSVLRAKLNVSQQELADMIGASRSTIATIENKKHTMTWNVFLSLVMVFINNPQTSKLLDALDISTDEIKKMYLPNGEQKNAVGALTYDYDSVIHVDFDDGSIDYIKAGMFFDESMRLEIKGMSYSDIIVLFAKRFVVKEDEEDFINSMNLKFVINGIKNKEVYINMFRISNNNTVHWYEVRIAHHDDHIYNNCAIFGFRNIDKEMLCKEDKIQNLEKTELQKVVNGLSDGFESVLYVEWKADKNNDIGKEYSISHELRRRIPDLKNEKSFTKKLDILANQFVYEPDKEDFLAKTRRQVLAKELIKSTAYNVDFRAVLDNRIVYFQIKFIRDVDISGNILGMIVGIKNIDEEVKKEAKIKGEVDRLVQDKTLFLYQKNKSLNRLNASVIELFGDIIESRNGETKEHIQRVKGFTYILSNQVMNDLPEYNLTQHDVKLFTYASGLHDIGKISVPDSILLKPGKLTQEEFKIVKTHSKAGYEIIKKMYGIWSDEYVKTSSEIACCHHEKWDGKGYPRGLKGDQIPISAQIVSLADCYASLVSECCYHDAYSLDEAYKMIMSGACGAFSDKLLVCFSRCKVALEEQTQKAFEFIEYNDMYEDKIIMKAEKQQRIIRSCIEILNDDSDINVSISNLLSNAIDYYNADRASVYELNWDVMSATMIYENCKESVVRLIDDKPSIPWQVAKEFTSVCEKHGELNIFNLGETNVLTKDTCAYLMENKIYSVIVSPVIEGNNIVGFVEIDNPFESVDDILVAKTISTMIHSEALLKYKLLNGKTIFDGMRFLLVDDNDLTRELNKEILESEGAEVIEASSGYEALDLYYSDTTYDVVLMDIIMPNIDGVETTKKIRSFEAKNKIKKAAIIIGLTADSTFEHSSKMIAAGANDCVGKPLVLSELSKVIITCMRVHNSRMEEMLNDTIKSSKVDVLTKSLNVAAYTDAVSELSSKIKAGEQIEFALVMCDVNYLKLENDTYGHDVGDVYIVNCCNLIKGAFSNSFVYRIGGDEFVVILQGEDYNNAKGLVESLNNKINIAEKISTAKQGKASIAIGLAIYDAKFDTCVSDVFQRADADMYKRKESQKSGKVI